MRTTGEKKTKKTKNYFVVVVAITLTILSFTFY